MVRLKNTTITETVHMNTQFCQHSTRELDYVKNPTHRAGNLSKTSITTWDNFTGHRGCSTEQFEVGNLGSMIWQ